MTKRNQKCFYLPKRFRIYHMKFSRHPWVKSCFMYFLFPHMCTLSIISTHFHKREKFLDNIYTKKEHTLPYCQYPFQKFWKCSNFTVAVCIDHKCTNLSGLTFHAFEGSIMHVVQNLISNYERSQGQGISHLPTSGGQD